jgi:hypothetical protein
MKRLYITLLAALIYVNTTFAQNEFFINGATVFINGRESENKAALHVNGNIINDSGAFTNEVGLIEITGNWTNTPSVGANYTSTGIERFKGNGNNQVITGKWNGTSGDTNQFFNMEIAKVGSGYVSLDTNVNINKAGSIKFVNGIIRTDTMSHGSNGRIYAHEIYLQNPESDSLIDANTGYGATNKYIEGKLRRRVNTSGNYYFPIGDKPDSLDGMEAFNINLSKAPANDANLLG